MAVDRSRLAAALAYKQAEEERRRRMLESIPTPAGTAPAQPAPQADFRTNLENLSIGVGEGLTNQLEGIKGLVTDPVGTAKGVYEAGKAVVRDPAIIASALRQMGQKAMSGPLGAGEVIGETLGPRKTGPVMAELDVYHGTPHRFPATEANPLGEFDASKIGTGKGRNLKGKGIYLTENPERAKEYAESFVQPGFVYKSDLPDEMIEMMLEYDVPIKNQPEKVKKALKTVGIDPESFELAGTMVSGLKEGKNLIAEETLAKAGIPGMKVKNIRAKEKKYDFVVFPGEEKKVRILERDGQKAPPQKIAQALEEIKPVTTAVEIPEALHGSPVRGLTELSPSKAMEVRGTTWFSDNADIADQYTFPREYGEILYDAEPGEIYKAGLSFKNPLIVDFKGKVGDATELSKLVEQAKKQGYDGLIIRNVDDSIDSSKVLGTSYAVFDRNQIKLKK